MYDICFIKIPFVVLPRDYAVYIFEALQAQLMNDKKPDQPVQEGLYSLCDVSRKRSYPKFLFCCY